MKVRCSDCGWEGDYDDANLALDITERHTIGCVYSDRECPEEGCGSLCYPVEHKESYPWTEHGPHMVDELVATLDDMLGTIKRNTDRAHESANAFQMVVSYDSEMVRKARGVVARAKQPAA